MIDATPVTPGDEPFLFDLYASTRQAEVAGWGWEPAMCQTFLHMQWRAQSQAYAAQYPGADHRLIWVDGQPAGRLLVHRTDAAYRLIDIALLPAFQSRGIGGGLIRSLQAEAAATNRPIHLHVLRGNPARRLYAQLGFRTVDSDDAVYEHMAWQPHM